MNEPWIQTFKGLKFTLNNPTKEMILICDIAHALSMICRFGGHCKTFYSVAEHSVHVSHEIEPELALVGLLHDATEAYLGDMPSPLKAVVAEYKSKETALMGIIASKFGLDENAFESLELKRADKQLIVDEKAVLMVSEPEPWSNVTLTEKDPERIKCWSPSEAKERFMERFTELYS